MHYMDILTKTKYRKPFYRFAQEEDCHLERSWKRRAWVRSWSLATQSTWRPSDPAQRAVSSWRRMAAVDRGRCRPGVTPSVDCRPGIHPARLQCPSDWHTVPAAQSWNRHSPAAWTTDYRTEREFGASSKHQRSHLAAMRTGWRTNSGIPARRTCQCQARRFGAGCGRTLTTTARENGRRSLRGETGVRCSRSTDCEWGGCGLQMSRGGTRQVPGSWWHRSDEPDTWPPRCHCQVTSSVLSSARQRPCDFPTDPWSANHKHTTNKYKVTTGQLKTMIGYTQRVWSRGG